VATVPGTDIVLSGSWDGWIRAWKISEDKKTIIPLGPVGGGGLQTSLPPDTPSRQLNQNLAFNTTSESDGMAVDEPQSPNKAQHHKEGPEPLIKGVINDIAVFERRLDTVKPGQSVGTIKPSTVTTAASESETRGLCIVAAVGKEHRLGRWKCFTNNYHDGPASEGRNGAIVFEVPFSAPASNQSEV
jgi:ribosomal RNA-processing protein 9